MRRGLGEPSASRHGTNPASASENAAAPSPRWDSGDGDSSPHQLHAQAPPHHVFGGLLSLEMQRGAWEMLQSATDGPGMEPRHGEPPAPTWSRDFGEVFPLSRARRRKRLRLAGPAGEGGVSHRPQPGVGLRRVSRKECNYGEASKGCNRARAEGLGGQGWRSWGMAGRRPCRPRRVPLSCSQPGHVSPTFCSPGHPRRPPAAPGRGSCCRL